MKSSISIFTVLTFLFGALLSACVGPAVTSVPRLDGTDWQLIELNGKQLPIQILITLGFKDGQAGGNAACNSYGASYTQNGSTLTFDEAISTMMYCEGVMDYEIEFLAAFSKVNSFRFENDALSLLDGSGAVILVFSKPQAAPALDGSTWKAIMVGETSVPEDIDVTMSFVNGQITGKAA